MSYGADTLRTWLTYIPPSAFDSRELIQSTPELTPTESFSILVFAIIAAVIVSIALPGKGQQKFWPKSQVKI